MLMHSRRHILIIFCFFCLAGCNYNSHKILGVYTVTHYRMFDQIAKPDLPVLTLYKDHEFLLRSRHVKVNGTWQAQAYGKMNALDLKWGDHSGGQAFYTGTKMDTIKIYDPSSFNCFMIKYLEFAREKKGWF